MAHVTLGPHFLAVQNHPSAATVCGDSRTPKAGVLTFLYFAAGQRATMCRPPFWLYGECAGPGREAGCWHVWRLQQVPQSLYLSAPSAELEVLPVATCREPTQASPGPQSPRPRRPVN